MSKCKLFQRRGVPGVLFLFTLVVRILPVRGIRHVLDAEVLGRFGLLLDNLQVWKVVIIREPELDVREELDKEAIEIDREDGTIYAKKIAHIKGTRRNFVEPNEINVWKRKDGNACIAVEFRAAC